MVPTFQEITESITSPDECHAERQKTIREIESITSRRLLVYFAEFGKPLSHFDIDDKLIFSDLIEDVQEGNVDILIHSPGGVVEVTESIVGMLHAKFKDIRFAIPNMAKSAATLLAFSGSLILMDARSELGPIDPQLQYMTIDGPKWEAAQDILSGFQDAIEDLRKKGPEASSAYVPLLSKYTIGMLRECKNANALSRSLAETWLSLYMFAGEDGEKAKEIAHFFVERDKSHSHSRAFGIDVCIEEGLKILDLRKNDNRNLGRLLWKLWCLLYIECQHTDICKIAEHSSLFLPYSVALMPPSLEPPQGASPNTAKDE